MVKNFWISIKKWSEYTTIGGALDFYFDNDFYVNR